MLEVETFKKKYSAILVTLVEDLPWEVREHADGVAVVHMSCVCMCESVCVCASCACGLLFVSFFVVCEGKVGR